MLASVIVPNYRNDDTLPATLKSLEKAACEVGRERVEIIVVADREGRGLSWARNEGLGRARGKYVFFCDADDTVEPGFFARPIEKLEASGADFCFFNNTFRPLKRQYELEGRAVLETLAPAFIGYSWGDLARALLRPWRFMAALAEKREQGSVCRIAFRRELLAEHRIRFDEELFIYEDAPFVCECAIWSKRVASIPDVLYRYTPGVNGIVRTVTGSARHWAYKSAILRERKRLDEVSGGRLKRYFGASQVLGKIEFLLHSRGKYGIILNHKPQTGL